MNKLVKLFTGVALFLLVAMVLVSCSGGGSGTVGSSGDSDIGGAYLGTLSLGLTDGPPPRNSYDAIYVTIKEIRVGHMENGWVTLNGPDLHLPQTFNLLELVNGVIADLGAVELEAGYYNQMRLILGKEPADALNILGEQHEYANYLILKGDDEQIPLKVPSGYQTGIKLVKGFNIEHQGSTELVLDFDANKSIVKAGKSGKWLLKPTIKVIESISYSVEGFVEDNQDNRLAEADVSAQIYDSGVPDPKDEVTVAASSKTNDNGYYFIYLPFYQKKFNIVTTMDEYLPACQVLDANETGIQGYVMDFALTPAEATGTFIGSAIGLESPDDTALFSIRLDDASCGMIEVASRSAVNTTEEPVNYFDPITLPVGTYEVVVSAEGEVTRVLSIQIAADTETVLDVFFSEISFNCDFTEREALIALYNSTDGANWIENSGWLGEPGTECTWYGITCQDSKVTNIDLEENNLVGTMPPEIGCMPDLLDLRLHRNSLSGSIQAAIGGLINLEYLNLSTNQLEGPIPTEIGDLDNLQNLHLYANGLTGPIPADIGNLTQLRELLLGANQLEGSIPPEIGNLINLENLNLHENQLTGCLPEELGKMSMLDTLNIRGNQLTCDIPATFSDLLLLETFNVGGNCITDFTSVAHVPNLIGADSQNDDCGI